MLAAQMIHRSSDSVWNEIKDSVIGFASRWHVGGEVDRAAVFMITTGPWRVCALDLAPGRQ